MLKRFGILLAVFIFCMVAVFSGVGIALSGMSLWSKLWSLIAFGFSLFFVLRVLTQCDNG